MAGIIWYDFNNIRIFKHFSTGKFVASGGTGDTFLVHVMPAKSASADDCLAAHWNPAYSRNSDFCYGEVRCIKFNPKVHSLLFLLE